MTSSISAQPDYVRYLESAKRAELAEKLVEDGFAVETDRSFGDVRFDLIATKDGRTTAYELRSVSKFPFDRERFRRLQHKARAEGFAFQTVIVNPPPRVLVKVEDLAGQLERYMTSSGLPPEVASLSPRTSLAGVYDLEFSEVYVGRGKIQVAGIGTLEVNFDDGSSSDSAEGDAFPLHFKVVLSAYGKLNEVEELRADTSAI